MTTTITMRGVGVRFGRTWPLRDIDLHIDAGELVGIVGPSGAGKTILLRLLLSEIAPSAGTLEFPGAIRGRRATVGYVPQLDASERTFPVTVQGAVELGAAATSSRVPWFSRAERAAARRALERLGIGELHARGLHELSGGQFQRVLFARALVRVAVMEVMFNLLLALAVVTALQVLGVLLVAATLLLPAATASLAFGSFGRLTLASIGLGVVTAIVGLYISYYHDIASGPAIVLTGATLFLFAAVGLPNRFRHSRAAP